MNPNDWNQAGTPSDPNLATPQDVNQSGTMAQNIPNPWNTAGTDSVAPQAVPTPDPVTPDPVMPAPVMTPDPAAPMDSTVAPVVQEDGMTDVVPRDPNVLNFMASAVIEKHGENADPAFLMSCIPDLTSQIEKVLLEYKEKYIFGF